MASSARALRNRTQGQLFELGPRSYPTRPSSQQRALDGARIVGRASNSRHRDEDDTLYVSAYEDEKVQEAAAHSYVFFRKDGNDDVVSLTTLGYQVLAELGEQPRAIGPIYYYVKAGSVRERVALTPHAMPRAPKKPAAPRGPKKNTETFAKDELQKGTRAYTKVGENVVLVEVVRVENRRGRSIMVRRVDNGLLLPGLRASTAMHKTPGPW